MASLTIRSKEVRDKVRAVMGHDPVSWEFPLGGQTGKRYVTYTANGQWIATYDMESDAVFIPAVSTCVN